MPRRGSRTFCNGSPSGRPESWTASSKCRRKNGGSPAFRSRSKCACRPRAWKKIFGFAGRCANFSRCRNWTHPPSTSHSKSTAYGIADMLTVRLLRFMSSVTPSNRHLLALLLALFHISNKAMKCVERLPFVSAILSRAGKTFYRKPKAWPWVDLCQHWTIPI